MPGDAPFALQVLKEMGQPVVTMTEAELAEKLAGAAAGEEGNTGAASGAPTEGATASQQAPATIEPKPGEQAPATAGKEDVKGGEGGESKGPKVIELPAGTEGNQSPAAKTDAEIDDETLLASVNKRFNLNLKSLDELNKKPEQKEPTDEEKKAAQEELREQAIQYGLKNKKFNSSDLEAYNLAKNGDQRELALEAFSAAMLKSEPELTADEIEERFSTYFGEALEDGHWLKNVRQTEMQNLAQMHLNNKFGAITNIADEYGENLRVEDFARKYKDEVENVFASYPEELKFKVGDKEYGFKPTADARAAIKEQFLTEGQMLSFGGEAPDPALIQSAVDTALKSRDLNRIVASVAKAHAAEELAKHHAGRKGALPIVEASASSEHSAEPAYNGHAMEVVERVTKA